MSKGTVVRTEMNPVTKRENFIITGEIVEGQDFTIFERTKRDGTVGYYVRFTADLGEYGPAQASISSLITMDSEGNPRYVGAKSGLHHFRVEVLKDENDNDVVSCVLETASSNRDASIISKLKALSKVAATQQ
jgi:hypothetical protein